MNLVRVNIECFGFVLNVIVYVSRGVVGVLFIFFFYVLFCNFYVNFNLEIWIKFFVLVKGIFWFVNNCFYFISSFFI